MPTYVRVRDARTGHEYTVTEPASRVPHLSVIGQPAVDVNGYPLPPKSHVALADLGAGDELRGEALDAALRDAGLPTTGKADEKRARLAEHTATTNPDDQEV